MSCAERKARSGFTLVEVMIAIGIMTVGSLGILSMHHAVSAANRSAHEMNTAIAITERWVERIDRDALSWTEEGINTNSLTSTAYLKELAGSLQPTGWFTPVPTRSDEAAAFDYFGRDDTGGANTKYCVNLNMSWLRQGSSARVDIRTFWFREGYIHNGPSHPKWVQGSDFRGAACDAATADGWDLGEAPNVEVVFASTVVRWLRREAP
jgi:prepilin-type N-terminal cleavage/methylation domain-containing protein